MKPSFLVLTLALTLGTYAHAAPESADSLLTGVSMNTAKRLDALTPPNEPTQAAKPSGVPMAVAARHGAAAQPDRKSPTDPALSGIPMALAKRQ